MVGFEDLKALKQTFFSRTSYWNLLVKPDHALNYVENFRNNPIENCWCFGTYRNTITLCFSGQSGKATAHSENTMEFTSLCISLGARELLTASSIKGQLHFCIQESFQNISCEMLVVIFWQRLRRVTPNLRFSISLHIAESIAAEPCAPESLQMKTIWCCAESKSSAEAEAEGQMAGGAFHRLSTEIKPGRDLPRSPRPSIPFYISAGGCVCILH
ncbi:uncharacterized protein LOC128852938 [Cuculus canorus]|uniref:uncharacterized protein LOC128852938 n=1 Tax=Cuculus canorus TaxID=55661 RepID=UPI0023AA3FC1|nr:uncharacterized protein LOC128852938 [Cuculus canorus]